MKPVFRFLSLLLLFSLVFQSVPAYAAQPESPQLMPPNPRLYEKIAKGEVSLPSFMTNPAVARSRGLEAAGVDGANLAPLKGTVRVLAVAVDFSDNTHLVNVSAFDKLLFAAPVNGIGSVRDYYDEISYGQVDIVTVNLPSKTGWVRAPQKFSYYLGADNCTNYYSYPNNCQKLAEDVISAVNGVVDFSDYDNNGDGIAEPIVIIHSGEGAEYTGSPNDIWSHSWSVRNPRVLDGVTVSRYTIQPEYWYYRTTLETDMTIGVIAHEMGHGFWNLPDLYDRTMLYDPSQGAGNFDLMAAGSWNGPNWIGGAPAWPSAWTRI